MNETRLSGALPDVVVIDTCVLISNIVRPLLLRMAAHGCFRPAWSAVIGDEWQRTASRVWNVAQADVQAQWDALQQAFPGADQGDIAPYKEGLRRSDPKDWHVVAAARAARERDPASSVAVLTRNIRDFNRTELRGLGLSLFDPDQFLVRCWALWPDLMRSLFARMPSDLAAAGRTAPPIDVLLKRERLFRLSRLQSGQSGARLEPAVMSAGTMP